MMKTAFRSSTIRKGPGRGALDQQQQRADESEERDEGVEPRALAVVGDQGEHRRAQRRQHEERGEDQ